MTTQNQRGAPPDDAVGIVIEAGADPKPGEGCPDVKGNDISGWEIRCSDKCDGDWITQLWVSYKKGPWEAKGNDWYVYYPRDPDYRYECW